MKMSMKQLAQEFTAAIREHITERLTPISSKLDASLTVINATRDELTKASERIDLLEAEVRDLQAKLQLRRVA
jgi:polyhydroxyalkanoate synthesis regulator phasin